MRRLNKMELTNFMFEGKNIRMAGTPNQPWFCGRDVCEILEYKEPTQTTRRFVRARNKKALGDILKIDYEAPMGTRILKGLDLTHNESISIYVNEPGLYQLIMKSKQKKAEEFQDYVCDVILPGIRKNGYFLAPNMNQEEIKRLQDELQEKELALQEKDNELNRLHLIQRELLTYKKKVSKDQSIYIVSTWDYARQGIFKVGRTKQRMKRRVSGHNVSRVKGDGIRVLAEFKVNDSVATEKFIHSKLSGVVLDGEIEFFMAPFDRLRNVVEYITQYGESANDLTNDLIDVVYASKHNIMDASFWMNEIPENTFVVQCDEGILRINNEEICGDVSTWSENQKRQFVSVSLKKFVAMHNADFEGEFRLVWKMFQSFLIDELNIPKSHFKAREWRPFLLDEAREQNVMVQWICKA